MEHVSLGSKPVEPWRLEDIAKVTLVVSAVAVVASAIFLGLTLSGAFVVPLTAVIVVGVIGLAVVLVSAVYLAVKKYSDREVNLTEGKLPNTDYKASEKRHIQTQIDNIPNVLADLNNKINDKDRLQLIQERMKSDFPEDENQAYVTQFKLDMERGVTFIIKDSASLENGDLNPQPSKKLSQEEKTEAAAKALQNLFIIEKDKKWEKALQLVANQTSLNNILDAPMMMFNISASSSMWEGPNREYYALKTVFTEKLPPISLKIIRNEITQEIEKVNVEVEGGIDIISYNTGNGENKQIVQQEAIKGHLAYTVTLDENGRPKISDLHSSLETSPNAI